MCDCHEALEALFAGEGAKLSDNELRHAKALIEQCKDTLQLVADQNGLDLEDEGAIEDVDIEETMNNANDNDVLEGA
jgi:hypothetical protein